MQTLAVNLLFAFHLVILLVGIILQARAQAQRNDTTRAKLKQVGLVRQSHRTFRLRSLSQRLSEQGGLKNVGIRAVENSIVSATAHPAKLARPGAGSEVSQLNPVLATPQTQRLPAPQPKRRLLPSTSGRQQDLWSRSENRHGYGFC